MGDELEFGLPKFDRKKGSLRASSPVWASEASEASEASLLSSAPSLARCREAHFAYPNRRACSQARKNEVTGKMIILIP